MIGYIYYLHKESEHDAFYVGSTGNPKSRIRDHRQTYPYYLFNCRIDLAIIEEIEVKDGVELRKYEGYWVQQFIAWGFKLTNRTLYYGFDIKQLEMYIKMGVK